VEYGLCIATNSTVILISIDFIRFTKGNGAIVNEMRFSSQPVYSIPTDNLIINTLKASRLTGRIFMGGKDGSLYEFFYQVTLKFLIIIQMIQPNFKLYLKIESN